MLNIPEYKEYGGETKIALMDNSSLAFMHELSQRSYPSDRILSVYDLILIPKWVMEEIEAPMSSSFKHKGILFVGLMKQSTVHLSTMKM